MTAIVLGGSTTGLGVVRSLAPEGIHTVVIDSNPRTTCFYSKQCEAIESPVETDVGFLLSLARRFKDAVLFPTTDAWCRALAKHRDELGKHFLYDFLSEKQLDRIMDRRKLYKAAKDVGVAVPKTYKKMPDRPCIIKPIDSARFYEVFYSKGFIAEDKEGFERYTKEAKDAGFDTVAQEIIAGPETNLYTFGSYIDKEKHPAVQFIGKKLRQYPPNFGTCTLGMQTEYYPELQKQSFKLLKHLGYSGASQVEFKRGRDGVLYLMEINPRLWLQSRLGCWCCP